MYLPWFYSPSPRLLFIKSLKPFISLEASSTKFCSSWNMCPSSMFWILIFLIPVSKQWIAKISAADTMCISRTAKPCSRYFKRNKSYSGIDKWQYRIGRLWIKHLTAELGIEPGTSWPVGKETTTETRGQTSRRASEKS